ncbi:hypothetical protein [Arcticibacter eurypsychrophilus]|uniref:hypothetical protein n=1 Tax=Arcticibacter eurypsychrophilus TaxID=1434752 RepID=UPI001FE1A36B|nr:hypothetical protein [Arcticibacter eurypsychrophilus]
MIILSLVTCSHIGFIKANGKSTNHLVRFQIDDFSVIKKDSSFLLIPKQFTPLSFIKALTITNEVKHYTIHVTTMTDDFPDDWVKYSDLDSLMDLIGSTRKCNCFLNPLSSNIPTSDNADVGGYAIIFINSFRQKKRVSLGLYNCAKTNKESVDDILKWWKDLD